MEGPKARFELQGGMNTSAAPDTLAPGQYPYLQNVRRNQSGRISSRPPLSANLLGGVLPAGVTSLLRLNDTTNPSALPAGFVLIEGANNSLYVATTQVASGFTGNPLGVVTFRPNASPQPWAYYADGSLAVSILNPSYSAYGAVCGMVKVRSDGTCFKTGIKEPQAAPSVTFVGGGSGTTQIQYRAVFRSSITGALSNPSPESVAGTNAQFGPSATQQAATGGVINPDVTVNATQYEGNGTQIRTKGGVGPGVLTDPVVPFNFGFNIPDGTQVANVTGSGGTGMTPGTYPLVFAGGSPTTPATGTITVLTATTFTIALSSGGKGYHSVPTVTAATGGTPPALLAILTTAANIDGIQIDLNWVGQNAGTGVLSVASLWYQGAAYGTSKFPGIANQSFTIDTLLGGNSDTWGATALTPAVVNDSSFGFGVQVTTQLVGGTDRSFFDFFTITVYYSTQNANLTPQPSNDPQVDKIDFYRFGGALANFTYVGTGPNSATVFNDTLSDLSAIGNPLLQFDNYEPFPSIGLPLAGVATVSAGAVSGTMQMTVTSGNNLPLNMLPGTDIIIGSIAYTTYNRPTSSTAVTLVLPVGQSIPSPSTGLTWNIAEPDLAATPSPVLWGPTPDNGGSFCFGLDPINTGDLLWTLGNNFDSADQGNRLNVTTPSEPLMNGVITSECAVVFSTDRFWLIYPNFASVDVSETGTEGTPWTLVQSAATRGLYMRYALDALGATIAWRAKDSICVSMGGGPEEVISGSGPNMGIYNLFPHGGQQPAAITLGGYTVYPPDDTKPNAQTIKIAPGYIIYNYQDTTATPRTLVYDMEAKGWSVDVYTPTVNCHLWAVGPVAELLTGCSDGSVRQLITGGTETGTSVVFTRSEDGGSSRVVKRMGGWFLRAVANSAVTLSFWAQRFQTAITGFTPSSVTGTSGVSQDFLIDFTSATNGDVRDVGAVLSWPLGSGNYLSAYQIDWQAVPEQIIGFKTGMLSYGSQAWMTVPWIELAYQSTATVTLVMTLDWGGTITLSFPATSGVQAKAFMTLPPNKFKLAGWTMNSAQPFTAYAADSEMLLCEWGTASRKVNPFQGWGVGTSTT